MRTIVFGILVSLLGSVLTGCATSTTVSQYAGLPRHLLPKDHFEYRPLNIAAASRTRSAASISAEASSTNISAELSFDEENARLSKLIHICQNCKPSSTPSPSYESPATLQTHDAAIARAMREITQSQ